MKGWIALDIDGTLTQERYSIPKPVIAYLHEQQLSGWSIAIATGRSSLFACMALSAFDFPYVLLAQNGSVALQMPQKNTLYKKYLPVSVIADVEKAISGIRGNFLVYSGPEKGDLCYYKPDTFSSEQLDYVLRLQEREKEPPRPIDSFQSLTEVPLIKCFGSTDQMAHLAERLRKTGHFQIAFIRDPFEGNDSLLLLTEQSVCKGSSLQEIMNRLGRGEMVIAAGDDANDESLLEQADIKIVMPQAPDFLKQQADLIAPPVSKLGILTALQEIIGHGN